MTFAMVDEPGFGPMLRQWRTRRRLSQLEVANRAAVSARHLSFLETGRAKPSREMVLHLAEELDVPLRVRNSLLVSAGFAPAYRESTLAAPELTPARDAIELILASHQPYPAVVVNGRWEMLAANAALSWFAEGISAELLVPPANVVRASLHPLGLAPRIRNLAEYSAHLVGRIRRQADMTGDGDLAALVDEVRDYPGVVEVFGFQPKGAALLPLRLELPDGRELSLFSTIATFGTAADVTLDELAIESFFPADDSSAAILRRG